MYRLRDWVTAPVQLQSNKIQLITFAKPNEGNNDKIDANSKSHYIIWSNFKMSTADWKKFNSNWICMWNCETTSIHEINCIAIVSRNQNAFPHTAAAHRQINKQKANRIASRKKTSIYILSELCDYIFNCHNNNWRGSNKSIALHLQRMRQLRWQTVNGKQWVNRHLRRYLLLLFVCAHELAHC